MEYLQVLNKDKKLKKIIATHGPLKLKPRKDIFIQLVASIMSQQLSIKVADVIYRRFLELFENKKPSPQQLLNTSFEQLRGIGLSGSKVNYIKNVARFALEKGLDFKKMQKLSNEDLIEYLTEIKGVGRWTAEMQLIFSFGREDVFSIDDLGIQNAMIRLYQINCSNKKEFKSELVKIASLWSPYRSYACLHLWKSKDG